ncbi:MAG: ATP-binding cassette domain-containing protein [Dysosmobacter welbionis]
MDREPVYENPGKKALLSAIPDDWYYFPSATVRDMMRFYKGFYPSFDMDRYEKFKEVFSIGEKSVIRRLSKGMQKQVAFWLAMCCRPRYLVLDEPVDGLDPVMRRQVWSLMMSGVSGVWHHGAGVLP